MVVQSSTHGMTENSYPSTILTRLSEQRLQGLFCDVTIVVEDIKFRAHRNILAATSGYFHNAFTASDTFMSGQVLELPDLKSEVFASILNFMYSSRVESANTENNKNLVAAGKRLGIPFLEKLLETPQESEKRHIHRKGTTSISDETKVSIQNPGRSPVVQNIVPDPSSIVQSPAALSGSSPNLLAPVEVTPPQDADPPSLIPENISSASVYHCQQCTEAFSNLALLTIHMQIHNRRFVSHLFLMDPTLTCPLETPLDGIAKSNSQRAYKCSMCKRAYVTLSSLKRHENVHSWQRAYPCHYCNKVFALAEYRTKHEIWHTGERRYQCIFCLETFMTYYILKNHQKSFHGIDPRLAVNKKSANGGLKGSVYPIKLYRLLPMKFRKKRYNKLSELSAAAQTIEAMANQLFQP
uniref:Zinc finger and BTB domain containing 38 n=1 Tax=Electrophorus electricus TaxID=8005 RepID=A0A4W4E2N0_ELEEL